MAIPSELWAELLGLQRCRSNDCDEIAEFTVRVPEYRPMIRDKHGGKFAAARLREPEWGGPFCAKHLVRVLDVILAGLHFHQPIEIERIHRI
jgi:hypothetical protein